MRPHAFTSRLAVTVMATLAVCSLAAARPDTRTPLQKALDSLFCAARYDTLRVLLPALIRDAEARGDSAGLGRLTFHRGRVEITLGHQAVANGLFDRSIRLCEAARDTVGLLPALHFKAFVLRDKGHPDDAMKLFEREYDLANRAHILSGQAAGIGNLAYKDLRRGNLEAARAGFVRSMALNHKAGNEYNVVAGMLSMGMLQRALGNVDSTRYWYKESLRVCRERHYPLNELWSLNNLGNLEGDLGNDEAGVEYYSAALKIGRRIGFDRGIALPLMNLGSSWSRLGEFDRARAALDEAVVVCERAGFNDLKESNINALAELYLETGQSGQAAQTCRRILREPDVFMAVERNNAAYGLALALADLDSVHAAVQELEPFVAPAMKAPPDQMLQSYIELTYADLLRRDGRAKDALDRVVVVRDDADRAGRTDVGVSARLVESSCRRALGDGAAAAASLHAAMDSLEVARIESGKDEGREAYGQHMNDDVIEASHVMLEYPWSTPRAQRVSAFYDVLQRFKTRTLLERIRDPNGKDPVTSSLPVAGTVTVSRLQKNVLHRGELLIDFFVSKGESFMFAVTADSCRLVRLPGSRSDLANKAKLYTDLLSEPSSKVRSAYPVDRLLSTQRALGMAILDPVADLIDAANRVIYAPEGFYASIPLETLVPRKGGMLLESKDVMDVPSASVLERARSRGSGIQENAHMLAVTDETAGGLDGARHETDQLRRRYASVRIVSARDGILDTLSQQARPGCILHIAAHARVNDASPWHSGFLLATAANASPAVGASAQALSDTTTFLRAWEIARTQLHYDMAVLAGCETAAGRATSGEGVLGLTSAFLSAGVPVVVSSRWAVDDKVTAVLMGYFYDNLARGENVAAALRDAQLAVRRNRSTRHPFYWAGFSVAGDGTRVISPHRLPNRYDLWWFVYRFTFVFLGVLGWQMYRRRRRSVRPAAS